MIVTALQYNRNTVQIKTHKKNLQRD